MHKVVRVIARLNIGGPAIHVILLAHRLRPRYETVLVSGIEGKREGNMLALAARLGVKVARLPELGRDVSLLGDLVSLARLVRLIARERPEIVHTHTAKAGLVGRIAARLCRVPIVVHTFHGHVFRGYFGPAKTWLFLTLERLLARLTDRILTVNEEQRQELIGFRIAPSKRIHTMLLGLDLTPLAAGDGNPTVMRHKWGLPLDSPLVGIVARLVPVKGHELFLDAAALLSRRRPEVRFVLVGDGDRRGELEDYAAACGVSAVFAGWETDLKSVYAALDVVCLTSFNEGSPVALIEALTSGKPVVSTPAGGVVDLIRDGENGLLVSDRDPGMFSQAVERLLESHQFAETLARNGRASVYPHYDISRLTTDMAALYSELLREKGLESRGAGM